MIGEMADRVIALLLGLVVYGATPLGAAQTEPAALRQARERERVTRLEGEAARSGEFNLIADAATRA